MRVGLCLIGTVLLTTAPLLAANEDGSAVAVLENGRTLAPIRAVTEWLGASVQWSAQESRIVIARRNTTVHLRPGSPEALLNGEPLELDRPPEILAGVTYVPARFVAETFGASPEFDGRVLTLYSADRGLTIQMRVAIRAGEWLTYLGPWFDIDYPVSFRPLGYDHSPGATDYDEDGMRFESPDGEVEFYVYSPLWSGEPGWVKLAPGETLFDRNSTTEGSGIETKQMTWVTVVGPTDEYTRSWLQVRQPQLNVKYYLGIRYNSLTAYERWLDEYVRFRESLVQYAD